MSTVPTTCDRHWGREAVGLYTMTTSKFALTSWMCAECRLKFSVRRQNRESRRRLSLAERKTVGE